MKKVLGERLGWDPGHIIALTGAVTKAEIRENFGALRTKIINAASCDLFLFLLSTHGHIYDRVQRGKTSTLLASDTSLQDQLLIADTGLTRDILGAYVDSIPARQKVVILDACFASSALSAENIAPNETYKDLDAAVLSSAIGRSYAQKADSYSLFTGHLIDVLSTLTGEIGIGTVFDSVSRKLPSEIQRPFFDSKARYISLGTVGAVATKPQLTYQNLLDFTKAQLTLAQNRYSVQGWNSANYVSRKALELSFSDHLRNPHSAIFTLTGAAGSGKTTSLLFLAQTARDKQYPVLWYSRADLLAYPTPFALISESLHSISSQLSMSSLEALVEGQEPIIIFLDAINEWSSDPVELAGFCGSLKSLPPNLFRVVLSCRDEAWPSIANALLNSDDKSIVPSPSAHLGDFNDVELAEAQVKSQNKFVYDWPNARSPLFFRILSDIDSDFDRKTTRSPYSLMFSRYLEVRLSHIEDRYSFAHSDCVAALDKIMRQFNKRRVQTMLAVEFLEIVGDRMGTALLDEGLVRRVGSGIAIENESLHQFLLSRILPPDPFASTVSKDLPFSDPWWGAAAVRLLEMQDTGRVIEIMRQIRSDDSKLFYFGSTIYILNVLSRVSSIEPFKEFMLEELFNAPRFHTDEILKFASSILSREGPKEVAFVLSVLRALFRHTTGDWRAKIWSDWSTYNFTHKISSFGPGHPADLLFTIMKTHPREAFPILISRWLSDSTLLQDGEAQIQDVAFAFLLNISVDAVDDFVDAITDSAELVGRLSGNSAINLRRVLERIGAVKFDHFITRLVMWLNDPRLRDCAFTVITRCPDIYAAEAVAAVKEFVCGHHVDQESITIALASLGNIDSRRIVEYYQSTIDTAELQPGVIRGAASLLASFPQEVMSLVSPLFNYEMLRRDTLEAIEMFCRHHLCSVPTKVAPLLARLLEEYPGAFGRDIAIRIASCKPSTAITELVERQLLREADGVALEHLLYYLCNVRPLKASDTPWIRRWVMSGRRLFGLLVALGKSGIPTNKLIALITEIDRNDDDYLEATANSAWHSEDGDVLKALASVVVASEEFKLMRTGSKKWFTQISDGQTASDALNHIREEQWRELSGKFNDQIL
jgi:hypothetical protein